ncbi:MAG TPA: SpoIID/LytB domain-containing protein [Candidatus Acidoferrum sp.]|nr:SpoIID/LytB domain-containing protein [Candidatus Acidoferrum sp.]
MIRRRGFVTLALATAAAPMLRSIARAQEYDPAMNASSAALRVLLGPGRLVNGARFGFTFNGRAYRGTASRLSDGNVVTTVPLEEYLYSVVSHEMTPSWPVAALQAQAVSARTYVLQRSDPRHAYDVVPSELDQVYTGIDSETPASRAAVDSTAGMVLRFGEQYARLMYSSCCGGHTEAASEAWGGTPIPYLAGVVCTTCTASPYYRWSRTIDLAAVASAFLPELQPVGSLQALREGDRDASGRVRAFVLQAEHGSLTVKGATFRLRVGPRTLPSLLISRFEPATEAPERIVIEGGGLGHGVGLCQWGARGLALGGASFSDILRFYFPGTESEHE